MFLEAIELLGTEGLAQFRKERGIRLPKHDRREMHFLENAAAFAALRPRRPTGWDQRGPSSLHHGPFAAGHAIGITLGIRQRSRLRRQRTVCGPPARCPTGVECVRSSREVWAVADLGFVLLTVVAFAVLILVLRGTERL